jgi:hypothetical protein
MADKPEDSGKSVFMQPCVSRTICETGGAALEFGVFAGALLGRLQGRSSLESKFRFNDPGGGVDPEARLKSPTVDSGPHDGPVTREVGNVCRAQKLIIGVDGPFPPENSAAQLGESEARAPDRAVR